MRVAQSMRDEPVVHTPDLDQRVVRLWYDRRPVVLVGRVDVDGDESRPRSTFGRSNEEYRPVVSGKLIDRIGGVEQLHDRRAEVWPLWVVEIDEKEPVLILEPTPRGDHQVLAILADIGAQTPRRVVRALEHKAIVGLRASDAM